MRKLIVGVIMACLIPMCLILAYNDLLTDLCKSPYDWNTKQCHCSHDPWPSVSNTCGFEYISQIYLLICVSICYLPFFILINMAKLVFIILS